MRARQGRRTTDTEKIFDIVCREAGRAESAVLDDGSIAGSARGGGCVEGRAGAPIPRRSSTLCADDAGRAGSAVLEDGSIAGSARGGGCVEGRAGAPMPSKSSRFDPGDAAGRAAGRAAGVAASPNKSPNRSALAAGFGTVFISTRSARTRRSLRLSQFLSVALLKPVSGRQLRYPVPRSRLQRVSPRMLARSGYSGIGSRMGRMLGPSRNKRGYSGFAAVLLCPCRCSYP